MLESGEQRYIKAIINQSIDQSNKSKELNLVKHQTLVAVLVVKHHRRAKLGQVKDHTVIGCLSSNINEKFHVFKNKDNNFCLQSNFSL